MGFYDDEIIIEVGLKGGCRPYNNSYEGVYIDR